MPKRLKAIFVIKVQALTEDLLMTATAVTPALQQIYAVSPVAKPGYANSVLPRPVQRAVSSTRKKSVSI